MTSSTSTTTTTSTTQTTTTQTTAQDLGSVSFPLQAESRSAACSCGGLQRSGWNGAHGMCMKGTRTTCQDCSRQRDCATIKSLIGDGVNGFQGDCRDMQDQSPGSPTCPIADKAAVAFPNSLAIDEEDNVYVSDHGNNRIRMYRQSSGTIVTIAGTGEFGWAGDGGPALKAYMRSPEGIVLRPGLKDDATVRREIYFSDYQNQRIRKLVLNRNPTGGEEWYVYPVAGTGVMGDKPACDEGCSPLEAHLNFPRSMAFSSTGDLYLVDSGNRKVRKLSQLEVGAPTSSSRAVFSTFVGVRGVPYPRGPQFPQDAAVYMPGHWSEPAENVVFDMIYHLQIDNLDNLWVVDSMNNRLLMVPLQSRNIIAADDQRVNVMASAYATKFAKTADERFSLISSLAEGLARTLPVLPGASEYNVSTHSYRLKYEANTSYWRYSQPEKGTWCSDLRYGDRGKCKAVPAQYALFQSIMSFCFDKTNNMYISDMEASEVLYIDRDSLHKELSVLLQQGGIMRTRYCPCKYNSTRGSYCTTEGSHTGVAWCYVDCSNRWPNVAEDAWGFCAVPTVDVLWEEVEGAIIGNQLIDLDRETQAVFVEQTGANGATHQTLSHCKERCGLDRNCVAFMAQADDALAAANSNNLTCVYFGSAAPFRVYPMMNASNGSSQSQSGIMPFSSYFNRKFGVDVGPAGTSSSTDLVDGESVFPELALRLDECTRKCVTNPQCKGVAYPGCYLLNEAAVTRAQDGANASTTEKTSAKVYVKKFPSEELIGIAGYTGVRTFQGEDSYLTDAYLNRPAGCAVNSRGDLVFVDVWNMRVRTVSGLIQDCSHNTQLSTKAAIGAWHTAIQDAEQACTGSSNPELTARVERMQQQVVEGLDTSLVDDSLCKFSNSAVNSNGTGTLTENTVVLCAVCQELKDSDGTWPDSPLCPWEEMCRCTSALRAVLETHIFQSCPEASAYHDKWHRWASGFVACLGKDPDAATWYTVPSKKDELKRAIQDS